MTSINISVKKDAYDFLKKYKARDQSFSDVILSFKKEKNVVESFFGVLKDLDWKKKEERMRGVRQSFEKRMQ